MQDIGKINDGSLSNGYLMRNTPISVFNALIRNYKLGELEDSETLVRYETKMTHSNPICLDSEK